jgi:hypothetical protein
MKKNNNNNKQKSNGSPMNQLSSGVKTSCFLSRKFPLFMVEGSFIACPDYKSPPLASACTIRTKFTIFESVSLNFILILSSTLKLCARSDLFPSGTETNILCTFVFTCL